MKRFLFNFLGALLALSLPHTVTQALPPVVFPPPDLTITPLAASQAQDWFDDTVAKLAAGSQITLVNGIPVEYAIQYPTTSSSSSSSITTPQYVLVLHGAPGGYDQGLLIGSNLVKRGYTVVAVSRPGYLRSELIQGVNQTPQQQANLMAGLMGQILLTQNPPITRFSVLGYSAGAPIAIQMAFSAAASAYAPLQISSLILESIGGFTQQEAPYLVIRDNLQFGQYVDLASYLLFLDFNSGIQKAKNTACSVLYMDNILPNEPLLERMNFVVTHKSQFNFLKNLVNTFIPISPRIEGLLNDIGINQNPWPFIPYNLLPTPTLIVESRFDNNFGYEEAVLAASSLPFGQLITLEESGDFVWLGEESHEWQEQVAYFLEANP